MSSKKARLILFTVRRQNQPGRQRQPQLLLHSIISDYDFPDFPDPRHAAAEQAGFAAVYAVAAERVLTGTGTAVAEKADTPAAASGAVAADTSAATQAQASVLPAAPDDTAAGIDTAVLPQEPGEVRAAPADGTAPEQAATATPNVAAHSVHSAGRQEPAADSAACTAEIVAHANLQVQACNPVTPGEAGSAVQAAIDTPVLQHPVEVA